MFRTVVAGLARAVGRAGGAWAQAPFRIGVVLPMTGPSQSTGKQIDAAMKLYMQEHGSVVAGHPVELILRDDAGVADTTRRLTQEFIVRDKVNAIAGFGLTPLAMAAAPLATQAKVPMMVIGAGTSSVTTQSPFIVRTGQTLPQPAVAMADWAVQNGVKAVVTLVSDYGPGFDAEKFFSDRFRQGGGEVLANLRAPLANPDFAPFLQRAMDARPAALFTFVPSGFGAVLAKQFVERGLDKSGVRLIATGDVTDDDQLNGMGDAVLGMVTSGPYSTAHPSEVNRAFVAAFEKANPAMRPNFMAVFGYDALHVLFSALQKTQGDLDGAGLVEAMKGFAWESPRGPAMIDAQTRDIVQNIYIRKVERQDGQLYNVEFASFPMMKDPGKAK